MSSDMRYLSPGVQDGLRLRVMRAAGNGLSQAEAARVFGVSRRQAKNNPRLRLYCLPGYSPQLNPDELLNQDVKANAVGRLRPRTQQQLIKNVRRFLWSTQRRKKKVQSYFRGLHVRYAA